METAFPLIFQATKADVGVYAEGEIQYARPGRQDAQLSGRGKDEDFLRRRLRKILRRIRIGVLQCIADGHQPLVQRFLVLNALVGPMRGEAVLGHVIHPARPDLHFHVGAFLVADGNMEALVAIRLGIGNPVPEAFGIRLILLRNEGIHLPAEVFLQFRIFVAIDDEADGEHIVNALEGHFLLLHLGPDGISGLRADLEFILDPGLIQTDLERFDELGHQLLPVLLRRFEFVGNKAVFLRFCISEIDILHLPLDVVQSQLMGKGNVEHQRLENLLLARSPGEDLQRAHHFQPVRQFENRHARITGVLYDQFLVILRFQAGIFRLDGRDLVESVHHGGNARVKPLNPLLKRDLAPRSLVQINRRDTFRRKADFVGNDFCHAVRMPDEGRAVVTEFILQGLGRHRISACNEVLTILGVIFEAGRHDGSGLFPLGAKTI